MLQRDGQPTDFDPIWFSAPPGSFPVAFPLACNYFLADPANRYGSSRFFVITLMRPFLSPASTTYIFFDWINSDFGQNVWRGFGLGVPVAVAQWW